MSIPYFYNSRRVNLRKTVEWVMGELEMYSRFVKRNRKLLKKCGRGGIRTAF